MISGYVVDAVVLVDVGTDLPVHDRWNAVFGDGRIVQMLEWCSGLRASRMEGEGGNIEESMEMRQLVILLRMSDNRAHTISTSPACRHC